MIGRPINPDKLTALKASQYYVFIDLWFSRLLGYSIDYYTILGYIMRRGAYFTTALYTQLLSLINFAGLTLYISLSHLRLLLPFHTIQTNLFSV